MSNIDYSQGAGRFGRDIDDDSDDLDSEYLILWPVVTFATTGIILFLLFCILRSRVKIYNARLLIRNARPPELPDGMFRWIPWIFRVDETKFVDVLGLDAISVILFLRMGLGLFLTLLPIGLICALINYLPNKPDLEDSDDAIYGKILRATTFENVVMGSWPTYAHIVILWVVSLVTYAWLLVYYKKVISLRRRRISQILQSTGLRHVEFRSIIVNNVPVELRNELLLKLYYEELGFGEIEALSIYRPCSKLRKVIYERWKSLADLERKYYLIYKRSNKPCSFKIFGTLKSVAYTSIDDLVSDSDIPSACLEDPNDARIVKRLVEKFKELSEDGDPYSGYAEDVSKCITHLKKFLTYDARVREMRKSILYTSSPTSVAFITFRNAESAIAASQTLHTLSFICNSRPAPEPRDVYWPSISGYTLSATVRVTRSWTIRFVHLLLVIFSAAIIVAVNFLVSVQSLKEKHPSFYNFIFGGRPYFEALFKKFMPTVVAAGYTSCLPSLLSVMTMYQGFEAKSWNEASILSKYFFYQIYNIVIVQTIASRLWSSDKGILGASISQIMEALGVLIPANSPHFIQYVALHSFVIFPLELVSANSVQFSVLLSIPRLLKITPRSKSYVAYPSNLTCMNYGIAYPAPILIFCIGVICASVAPFIIPACVVYFAVGLFARKYLLFYENVPKYETNGTHFGYAIVRCIWGLILMQFTVTGALILKLRSSENPQDPDTSSVDSTYQNHPETKFLKFWVSPTIMILLTSTFLMLISFLVLFWIKNGYEKDFKSIPLGVVKCARSAVKDREMNVQRKPDPGASDLKTDALDLKTNASEMKTGYNKPIVAPRSNSIFEASMSIVEAEVARIAIKDPGAQRYLAVNGEPGSKALAHMARFRVGPRKSSKSYSKLTRYLAAVHAEPPSYYIMGVLEPPSDSFTTLTGCNPYFWCGLEAITEPRPRKQNASNCLSMRGSEVSNDTTNSPLYETVTTYENKTTGRNNLDTNPPRKSNFLDGLLPRCSKVRADRSLSRAISPIVSSPDAHVDAGDYLESLCEYEDILLHCYINPSIIGRLPVPWLPGDLLRDPTFELARIREALAQWSGYVEISSAYLNKLSLAEELEIRTKIRKFIKRTHLLAHDPDLPFMSSLKLIISSARNWIRTKI